jgi:aminoglycoside phosphotransferase (APT) family kinase protein|tara:strand:- start:39 stop:1043 length:1005 start_codon:yes stop_codon:yes gene_type:complete
MEPEVIVKLDTLLSDYLRYRIPAVRNLKVSNVTRSTGGASRSQWFFDAHWDGPADIASELILRTGECTCFRDEEASLEREFRIYKCLKDSPVPVPDNYWYEEDPKWLGLPFVIRERLPGSTRMDELSLDEQFDLASQLIDILAAQHDMDWQEKGFAFLGEPPDRDRCAEHLVDQWYRVIRREQLEPSPLLTTAARWLRQRSPTHVDRICLCQGQVGPGQVLFNDGQIVGSLDWESAFLGDPMADIAYFSFMLRPILGDRIDSLLERYTRVTGLPIREENVRFYEVFNSFWVAAICFAARNRVETGEMAKLQTTYVGVSIPHSFLTRIAGHLSDH